MTLVTLDPTTRCHDCCERMATPTFVASGDLVCGSCVAAAYVRCDGCWLWHLTGDVEAVGTQIVCERCAARQETATYLAMR